MIGLTCMGGTAFAANGSSEIEIRSKAFAIDERSDDFVAVDWAIVPSAPEAAQLWTDDLFTESWASLSCDMSVERGVSGCEVTEAEPDTRATRAFYRKLADHFRAEQGFVRQYGSRAGRIWLYITVTNPAGREHGFSICPPLFCVSTPPPPPPPPTQ